MLLYQICRKVENKSSFVVEIQYVSDEVIKEADGQRRSSALCMVAYYDVHKGGGLSYDPHLLYGSLASLRMTPQSYISSHKIHPS